MTEPKLLAALVALLAWLTQWPATPVLVAGPLLLFAAAALQRRRAGEGVLVWLPPLSALVVLAGALLGVALLLLYGRGLRAAPPANPWSHVTTSNSLLPSNTVYAILPLGDGRVVLGTEGGVAIWEPATATLPSAFRVFTTGNSGLPSNRVLAAVKGPDGRLWFGTQAGVAAYDGTTWQTYRAAELGVAEAETQALVFDSAGRLYAGTQAGVVVLAEGRWEPLSTAGTLPAGLVDAHVFAAAMTQSVAGEWVWFGTLAGVSGYNPAARTWLVPAGVGPSGSINDLLADDEGRLWAGGAGGGLSLWDGTVWRTYQPNNPGRPAGVVNVVQAVTPWVLWVGTAAPDGAGGAVWSFDGNAWTPLPIGDDGYAGAEPLAIATDTMGRVWIGTRNGGVDVYQTQP